MNEWRIYFDIEPWGFYERDAQHSYTRKTFADVMGVKSASGKAVGIDDLSLRKMLMPKKKVPKQKQSIDEMKQTMYSIAKNGSKVER